MQESEGIIGEPSGDPVRQTLASYLGNYVRKNEERCDLTLLVGQQPPVPLRTLKLLAARSTVLSAMLTQPTGRFKDLGQDELRLPEDEPRIIRQLVNFLHTDAVDWDELAEDGDGLTDIMKLFEKAHYHSLDGLEAQATVRLLECLETSNVLGVLDFALTSDIENAHVSKLRRGCLSFIEDNTPPVLQLDGQWLSVDMRTIRTILEDRALRVREIELFEALQSWIRANQKNAKRQAHDDEEEEEEEKHDARRSRDLDEERQDYEQQELKHHCRKRKRSGGIDELTSLIEFRLIDSRDLAKKVRPSGAVPECELVELFAFASTHERTFMAIVAGVKDEITFPAQPYVSSSLENNQAEPAWPTWRIALVRERGGDTFVARLHYDTRMRFSKVSVVVFENRTKIADLHGSRPSAYARYAPIPLLGRLQAMSAKSNLTVLASFSD